MEQMFKCCYCLRPWRCYCCLFFLLLVYRHLDAVKTPVTKTDWASTDFFPLEIPFIFLYVCRPNPMVFISFFRFSFLFVFKRDQRRQQTKMKSFNPMKSGKNDAVRLRRWWRWQCRIHKIEFIACTQQKAFYFRVFFNKVKNEKSNLALNSQTNNRQTIKRWDEKSQFSKQKQKWKWK